MIFIRWKYCGNCELYFGDIIAVKICEFAVSREVEPRDSVVVFRAFSLETDLVSKLLKKFCVSETATRIVEDISPA